MSRGYFYKAVNGASEPARDMFSQPAMGVRFMAAVVSVFKSWVKEVTDKYRVT